MMLYSDTNPYAPLRCPPCHFCPWFLVLASRIQNQSHPFPLDKTVSGQRRWLCFSLTMTWLGNLLPYHPSAMETVHPSCPFLRPDVLQAWQDDCTAQNEDDFSSPDGLVTPKGGLAFFGTPTERLSKRQMFSSCPTPTFTCTFFIHTRQTTRKSTDSCKHVGLATNRPLLNCPYYLSTKVVHLFMV